MQRVDKSAVSRSFLACFLLAMSSNISAEGASNFVLPPVRADIPALPLPADGPTSFITYEGDDWSGGQKDLGDASSKPHMQKGSVILSNGDYVVYMSRDGHYYIPGGVNGFPVQFMVDSGAAFSSIPVHLALVTGIRAGVVKKVNSADGQINVGQSSGNIITIGSVGIANAHVLVIERLQTALLGAEILNLLDISYSKGVMTIKATAKSKPNREPASPISTPP